MKTETTEEFLKRRKKELKKARRLEELLEIEEKTLMRYEYIKGDICKIRLYNEDGLNYVESYLKPEQIKVIETLFKSFVEENKKEIEEELEKL